MQEKEFAREYSHGYSAVKHQRFVGTGYFDEVTQVIASGKSSVSALRALHRSGAVRGDQDAGR